MKYHVNLAGDTHECDAEPGRCPFGFHADTPEQAQGLYEKAQEEELFSQVQSRRVAAEPTLEEERLQTLMPAGGELDQRAAKHELELQRAFTSHSVMSNAQLVRRLQFVNETNAYLESSGYTSEELYSSGTALGTPVYTRERAREHEAIVAKYMEKFKSIPREGKAYISGGLGGAGKGYCADTQNVFDRDSYATVDPDDIKAEFAHRGMIPHVKGLTPMEASPLAHEEASHVSKLITGRLMEEKANIQLDVTMAGRESTRRKLKQLKDAGYETEAMFVDIEPSTSKDRGVRRYVEGMQEHTSKHTNLGGRPLPAHLVDNQRTTNPAARSKNALNLVALADEGHFKSPPKVFDNMGDAPRPIDYGLFSSRIKRES